jgi:hypothetical protein
MVDVVLTSIIFDWTFINPLIERDDGQSEKNEEQVLAQEEIGPEVYY